ncbi:MAG: glycosyltransferase family 39 protein [Elusimicrobia bacterium]|nr:glycosyltransferase family 39 protein [Elusimicrobiota bacterium]
MSSSEAKPLLVLSLFVTLCSAPFLGKAFHVDEALYIPAAQQILKSPLAPFDFQFNWYGRTVPYPEVNNTPPLLFYILALALKLGRGQEWAARLILFPFDLLAAFGLYSIARRFLSRPLLPALIVTATPAYLINMGHLMGEKLAAGFGLAGLALLFSALERRSASRYWASAAALAAALLCKYYAAFLLLPAAYWLWRHRAPPGKTALYLCLASSGLAAYWIHGLASSGQLWKTFWIVNRDAARIPTAAPTHQWRSILAFAGGCGLVTALWPYFLTAQRRRWAGAWIIAIALFWPAWDILAGVVRGVDRATGIIFSAGALLALLQLATPSRRLPGLGLWRVWGGAALALSWAYWSVMARVILWLLPPLIFCMAEQLERRWPPRRLSLLYSGSLAALLVLSLALAWVDRRYAGAQRSFAQRIERDSISQGRRVWCDAHWGLQHYLTRSGAVMLDLSQGGWDQVKPGDVVVMSQANTNVILPSKPVKARVSRLRVESAVPLRLISGWTGEAGFYSNVSGFLPFSFSLEPLEEFTVVEAI